MSNITISQTVLNKRENFTAIHEETKEQNKKEFTAKTELYASIFADFNYTLKQEKIDNSEYTKFVLGYFEVLERALLIGDEEASLQNIVNNCEIVLSKNLFSFEYSFIPVMVTIIENLKHFKSTSKIKKISKKVASLKEYKTALNKALKRAYGRRDAAVLLNSIELPKITKNLPIVKKYLVIEILKIQIKSDIRKAKNRSKKSAKN